jgi:hypothetical protein
MKEVNEQYGGVLPPDAVFRPDEEPAVPPLIEKPKGRSGRGERFALLNAFTDLTLSSLTGAEVKVWLILFRDLKRATSTARTGQADIARRAGLSRRGGCPPGATERGAVRLLDSSDRHRLSTTVRPLAHFPAWNRLIRHAEAVQALQHPPASTRSRNSRTR